MIYECTEQSDAANGRGRPLLILGVSSFMKINLLVILSLLAFSASLKAEEIPTIISQGFDAYQKEGIEAAWKLWNPDYGDKVEESKTSFCEEIKKAEKLYGKYLSYSSITNLSASENYQEFFVLARFDKAPLFFHFICYRPQKDWIIKRIRFQSTPYNFVPGFNKNQEELTNHSSKRP